MITHCRLVRNHFNILFLGVFYVFPTRKAQKKEVEGKGEDIKVAIRNVRRDANDKCKQMKKNSEMTEDDILNKAIIPYNAKSNSRKSTNETPITIPSIAISNFPIFM